MQLKIALRAGKRRADVVGQRGEVALERLPLLADGGAFVAQRVHLVVDGGGDRRDAGGRKRHRNPFVGAAVAATQEPRHPAQLALVKNHRCRKRAHAHCRRDPTEHPRLLSSQTGAPLAHLNRAPRRPLRTRPLSVSPCAYYDKSLRRATARHSAAMTTADTAIGSTMIAKHTQTREPCSIR